MPDERAQDVTPAEPGTVIGHYQVLGELGLPPTRKTTIPDRPGHDRRYLLDCSKIRNELGWRPEIEFEQGLKETIRWYADNRDWWTPLYGRSPVVEGAPARS